MHSSSRSNRRPASADEVSSTRIKNPPLVLVDDDTPTIDEGAVKVESPVAPDWPLLPWSRGPLSATVISALQRQPGTLGATPPVSGIDALSDDDFTLALYLCYEVHYHAVANAGWEWDWPGMRPGEHVAPPPAARAAPPRACRPGPGGP